MSKEILLEIELTKNIINELFNEYFINYIEIKKHFKENGYNFDKQTNKILEFHAIKFNEINKINIENIYNYNYFNDFLLIKINIDHTLMNTMKFLFKNIKNINDLKLLNEINIILNHYLIDNESEYEKEWRKKTRNKIDIKIKDLYNFKSFKNNFNINFIYFEENQNNKKRKILEVLDNITLEELDSFFS